MIDQPDWADEIAFTLKDGYVSRETIAAALRKAKADGLRLCADWFELGVPDEIFQAMLRVRADEVEKSQEERQQGGPQDNNLEQ